jgi:membrane protease subunit HflK
MPLVVFQQHRLEREEALEAAELEGQPAAEPALFGEGADELAVARRRLAVMHRVLLPAGALATGAFLVVLGLLLLRSSPEASPTERALSPLAVGCCTAGLAFLAFLVSRYVAGMARLEAWRLLRGGSAYLAGVALVTSFLSLGAFLQAGFETTALLQLLGLVIPVLMVLSGAEMILALVLELYRPRPPGEIPRPAFDSRLLGLLTTPESLGHTIAEAVNYQFGFEITRSWFWQLLSRICLRLVLLVVVALLALSSVVLVSPQQAALLTTCGQLSPRVLGPGLHLKLPWPLSRATHHDVTTVRTIQLGTHRTLRADTPILWTNVHVEHSEAPFIVASPPEPGEGEDPGDLPAGGHGPSVSLVHAEVVVQYRPDRERLINYVIANRDALEQPEHRDRRLHNLAQRELSRFLLGEGVDAWIGRARQEAGALLRERLQEVASGLGYEILAVQFPSIHPPPEVASAFQQVVGAEQERETHIEEARREGIQLLAGVAGTTERAEAIVARIEALEELDRRGDASEGELARARQEVEDLVLGAGGLAAQTIAEARGDRWERECGERGKAERFASQQLAHSASPEVYRARHLLQVLREHLTLARKVVLATRYGELTVRGNLEELDRSLEEMIRIDEGR